MEVAQAFGTRVAPERGGGARPRLRLLGESRQPVAARQGVGWFGGALVGGLAALAAFNWLVNPWRLYSPRLVQPRVAEAYYEKCGALRGFLPRPEQLVLGSSRTELFEPRQLGDRTGLRTFNASVPGATPVDAMVFYRFATETLRAPVRSVVLGVEPSTLRPGRPTYPSIARDPDLKRFLPESPSAETVATALRSLLAWAQARDSVRCLRRDLRHERTTPHCAADGWVVREGWERERRRPGWSLAESIRAQMPQQPLEPVDPAALDDLERLLSLLQRRGVRVTMIATPMLEEARAYWRRAGTADRETAGLAAMAALARAHGARFVDFSTVERFHGDPREFYDGIHATLPNTRRMIAALFPAP